MERRGNWLQTAGGRAFFPLDPRPEDVDILDIAHALSFVCRFGGHCLNFYSDSHAALAERIVPWPPRIAFHAFCDAFQLLGGKR